MRQEDVVRPRNAFSFKTLLPCYFGSVALVAAVQPIVWEFPSITQALIGLTYIRLACCALCSRHLGGPKVPVAANWRPADV